MAIAIPEAFGERGLLFAVAYVVIQVGRHTFLTFAAAAPGTVERARAASILVWFLAAGVLWIAGGIAEGPARTVLWLAALALDYAGPLVTFRVPGRPRLAPEAWEIGTEHFSERFQLFIIIALGETIVITGATTSELELTTRDGRRVRRRVPHHRGALVAVLQPRRRDLGAAARAGGGARPARPRRLHVPARRARRGDPARTRSATSW